MDKLSDLKDLADGAHGDGYTEDGAFSFRLKGPRAMLDLIAEIDRLRTAEGDAMTYKAGMENVAQQRDQLKAEVDSLTREADRQYTTIEAYRKNAERFQWLLKNASVILDNKAAYQAETGFIKFDTMPGRGEVESAIDAAMSKE